MLNLTPDELLSTTRAVRRRLDFSRPVPRELIRECVTMALQAPSGSNVVTARFVIITNPELRRQIGDIYRAVYELYKDSPAYAGRQAVADLASQARVATSADYLGEHMGEAPALVLACNEVDRKMAVARSGNVHPAMWSFMLAARARGLGTCWTAMHLARERDIADLLEIPYDSVAQVVLSPLAYTVGTDFKPASRPAPETFIHWDRW